MNRIPRLLLSVAATAALAGGTLAVTGSPGSAAADAQSTASSRLAADASRWPAPTAPAAVSTTSSACPPASTLDDPGVSSSTSVADAAAAHLARYGAAFGSAPARHHPDRAARSTATVTGDVVRYQQHVGGLPVMGGELVVSLRPNRELDSILAKTSRATKVSAATVSEAAATATAQAAFQNSAGAGCRRDGRPRWAAGSSTRPSSVARPPLPVPDRVALRADPRRRPSVGSSWSTTRPAAVLMNTSTHRPRRRTGSSATTTTSRSGAHRQRRRARAPTPPPRARRGRRRHRASPTSTSPTTSPASSTTTTYAVRRRRPDRRSSGATSAAAARRSPRPSACATPRASLPLRQRVLERLADVLRHRATPSPTTWSGHEMTHGVTERTSEPHLLGPVRRDERVDLRHHGRDHRPPERHRRATRRANAGRLGEDMPGFPSGDPQHAGPARSSTTRTGRRARLYVKEARQLQLLPRRGRRAHQLRRREQDVLPGLARAARFNGQTITGIDTGDADPDQVRQAVAARPTRPSPPAATTPTRPRCSTSPVQALQGAGRR